MGIGKFYCRKCGNNNGTHKESCAVFQKQTANTIYKFREIGESDWETCTSSEHKYYSLSPEYDTKITTR